MDATALSNRYMAKLGADMPPAERRTPQVIANPVGSEVAKWMPLLCAAGVVAE
jgi:hypothetical protein